MNRTLTLSALCIASTFLCSCRDLLEEDIAGFGVVLQTPPDGSSTSANVVQFRWEAVPGAVAYRIQIVAPDFANPALFLHDSLVTANSFSVPLTPGAYRWRVRGENPNSRTDYYERGILITAATTLDGLTPLLVSPATGAYTAADPLVFTWNILTGADDYRFELRSGGQSGSLVNAQIIAGTTVQLNDMVEGIYAWGVQGQNSTSTSTFSYRDITVDRTAPGAPVLLLPANSATLPNALFTFQWQSGTNSGIGGADSLFVLNSEQQTVRLLATTVTSVEDSLGLGTYTWYVRTTDAAGNGTASISRAFTVE